MTEEHLPRSSRESIIHGFMRRWCSLYLATYTAQSSSNRLPVSTNVCCMDHGVPMGNGFLPLERASNIELAEQSVLKGSKSLQGEPLLGCILNPSRREQKAIFLRFEVRTMPANDGPRDHDDMLVISDPTQ